jgi:hypothetical protein
MRWELETKPPPGVPPHSPCRPGFSGLRPRSPGR